MLSRLFLIDSYFSFMGNVFLHKKIYLDWVGAGQAQRVKKFKEPKPAWLC